MSRRFFNCVFSANFSMAAFIVASLLLMGCAQFSTRTASPRDELILSDEWQFAFGVEPTPQQLVSGDVAWKKISLPHTWNADDGADGGNDYARGTGWYFRQFPTDARWINREVFIQFDGANRNASVYLNGQLIGSHKGGYTRFRCNLGPALKPTGKLNTLAVKVSNAPDGLAPISADFTFFGGLYRSVKIFSVHRTHIDVTDHGSDGVYITPQNVSAKQADFEVGSLVRNDTDTARSLAVVARIRDARGSLIAEQISRCDIAAKTSSRVTQLFTLTSPRLWNGLTDPHLYTAEISVTEKGVVCDTVNQKFGLRFFHVDADRGFFLNGRYLDLHGVNRHQDRGGKGWALSEADDREDFALIREMGANTIRVAHYPQSALWYDLADAEGVALWAEIPVVNEVPDEPSYLENARLQLRELIRQNYNRPSIFFWGVGNETRQVGEGPGGQAPNPPAPDRVIAELAKLAREEDPHRLSVYASHHRVEDVRSFHTDVLAFNKYIGWYGGKAGDFGAWLDDAHRRYPSLKLGLSEYGAGASLQHHEIPPRKPAPSGPFHPEEYQTHFHEVYWLALRDRPYVWGKFIWSMFDFAADDRSEGDHAGMNDKGLVSYDRRTKKDAFFWYQAQWSDTPMLHLTSKRFNPRPAGLTEFKAYSNAPEVELWLDGRSLGRIANRDRRFIWSVELTPGAHHVVVRALHRGKMLTDEVHFTCPTSPLPSHD